MKLNDAIDQMVAMAPVSFDGCFGWIHTVNQGAHKTAVVLCPGLMMDEMSGYQSMRILADALASHGYPSLRLHYPGTGNSYDLNGGDAEYLSLWQQSINQAIDWLRERCGAERVILCGFRFGALLATTVAASRADVAGLVLLAPVLRGRSYVRQMMIETGQGDGSIDASHFRLSSDTLRLINQIELRKIPLRSTCKVGIFAQTQSGTLSECEDTWRKAGIVVDSQDFDDLKPMLRPTFANNEPNAQVDTVVRWVCKTVPDYIYARPRDAPGRKLEDTVTTGGYVETPMFFGAEYQLFGVLCQPHLNGTHIVVIIGNQAGDPHCAGATVDLARQLAAGGVASLRIDFSGVGDSVAPIGSHIFETDRGSDFTAAIDVMLELGYQKFATAGLCSGAYHAYHGAVTDPRIGFVLAINIPFFKWTPGFPVAELNFNVKRPTDFAHMMRTKTFWLKLWSKIQTGELCISRRFVWLEQKLRRVPWLQRGLRHLPGFEKPPIDPAELAKRVKMLFFVSEGDTSLEALNREFGAKGPSSGITIKLIPGLDHSMTKSNMRKIVASHIIAFIENHFDQVQ